MTAPGEALLVSCYEMGHQPQGLAAPLAVLRQAGFRPRTLDLAVEAVDEAALSAAKFIGISVPMHTAMRLGMRVARQARALNPTAHICFYGLYAALNRDYLLREVADSCLGGEYLQPLAELVRSLAGAAAAAGLATPPGRDSLPALERYAHLEMSGLLRPAGYAEATRGCAHVCRHCPITPVYRGRFVVVPATEVLADVAQQVAAGAEHITFGDPDFLNGPTHSLRICRELHRRWPNVTFDCTAKIQHVLERRAIWAELAALGCVFVVSAVETFNDRTLAILGKDHTRADIFAAQDVLAAAGIPLRPSLMPFNPWDSLEDYLDLLRFVEARGLVEHIDPVQYSIRLLVPPGSALLEREDTQAWIGPLNPEAFAYEWAHPDPRMDALQARVAALAAEAQTAEDPLSVTFARLREMAWETAGQTPPAPLPAPPRPRPPRLTEAWFC